MNIMNSIKVHIKFIIIQPQKKLIEQCELTVLIMDAIFADDDTSQAQSICGL
jgi:hypothetical protein